MPAEAGRHGAEALHSIDHRAAPGLSSDHLAE
jgi:hypothetical protein